MAYAIVRTDNMQGTKDPASQVSIIYFNSDNEEGTIENGNVALLNGFVEADLRKGVTPTANSALRDIVLVASPELMYDERKRNLNEFINEAGVPSRGYRLRSGNTFSVTKEALDGDLTVGNVVALQDSTKLVAMSEASGDATQVGTIIAKETVGADTYFVVEVV